MEDFQSNIRFKLEHIPPSLQVASRGVLTVTQLMKVGPPLVTGDLMSVLNDVFDCVVRSGTTKLRANTRLAILLSLEDGTDLRKKQKYESIMEEMRVVSVCVCVCGRVVGGECKSDECVCVCGGGGCFRVGIYYILVFKT